MRVLAPWEVVWLWGMLPAFIALLVAFVWNDLPDDNADRFASGFASLIGAFLWPIVLGGFVFYWTLVGLVRGVDRMLERFE